MAEAVATIPKSDQRLSDFVNPVGFWKYNGPYFVELAYEPNRNFVPAGVQIDGDTVSVPSGRVEQVIGGIQFYSRSLPFFATFKRVKAIRDGKGNLLWVNRGYLGT